MTVCHLCPIPSSLQTCLSPPSPPSCLSSSDVPHFQTTLLSWLSYLVKSLATMLWVGNTHRNTSPREVCHPSVCGSPWERWTGGRRGERSWQHIQIYQSCCCVQASGPNDEYRPANVCYFEQCHQTSIQVILPKIVWQKYSQYSRSFSQRTWLHTQYFIDPCRGNSHDFFFLQMVRSAKIVWFKQMLSNTCNFI